MTKAVFSSNLIVRKDGYVMKCSRGEKISKVIIGTILVLVALTTIYPFWHVIMYSLSDSKAAMSGGLFLYPREFTIIAYQSLLQTKQIFIAYKNSIIATVFGTLISMVLSIMTAYPLSIQRLKGRKFFTTMIFITMIFQGGMIPTYLLVKSLKLLDTLWALMLPGAISVYNLFILRNYFQSLPRSIEESALMDGANPLRILISIVIPLSKPAIAAVSMFYGVAKWNYYFNAVLYINDNTKQVLQVYLRSLLGSASSLSALSDMENFDSISGRLTEETMKMASIAASVIPVLIVYPWLQKYYVKGVLIGSVKG